MSDVAGKATLPANARRIPIPAAAMAQWLADIGDIVELKVTLRALALLADEPQRRRIPPSISLEDLLDDRVLADALSGSVENSVRFGLAGAIDRRTLIAVRNVGSIRVLLNDEDCRNYLENVGVTELTAADLTEQADANASERLPQPPTTREPRANIFALYEQRIGQINHNVAEQLRAAEEEYPAEWIEAALEIAAENDKRHWNYVAAILRRWVKEGRHEHGEPGSDTAPDSRTGYLDSYRRRHGRLPWESGEPERR